MNADFWALAASISQVLASISVIAAIIFAVVQLREATRTRYLEAVARIFEEFRSKAFFQDRRFIYSHDAFDYASCTDEERTQIERSINTFNRMSFLVEKGLLPKKLVLEMWSGALLSVWQKLESYVQDRRRVTGFSDWAIQFEHMAALSREYRTTVLGEEGVGYGITRQFKETNL